MSEVKTIADVQHQLRQIPAINSGGCGIAALAISRWLRKSPLHATSMIMYGHHDFGTYKQNNEAMINRENKPGSASHIGVLIYDHTNDKQMAIDCNGTFDISTYSYANICDEAFLLKSINEVGEWNYAFSRIPNVKALADALDIDLSDVDIRSKSEYREGKIPFKSYKKEEKDLSGLTEIERTFELAKAIVVEEKVLA